MGNTPYHPRGDGVYSVFNVQHPVHTFEQRFDEAANRHTQQHRRNQPFRNDFNHHQPRGEQHQWCHHMNSHGYDAKNYGEFVPRTSPPIAHEEEEENHFTLSMQLTLQKIIDAQTKFSNNLDLLNTRVDNMCLDLDSKFQSLHTHVIKLDLQVKQIAQAINETEIRNQAASPHELVGNEDLQNPTKELHSDVLEAHNSRKKGEQVRLHTSPEIPREIQAADTHVSSRIKFFENKWRSSTTKSRTEVQTHPQPTDDDSNRALEGTKENASTRASTSHSSGESKLHILTKQKDPGRFLFPCSIYGIDFMDSLCDSGSCVNIMPKWIASLLEITDIKPPELELILGDGSTKEPEGVAMNVMVKIDTYQTPVDFCILNLTEGVSNTLIFGRPFMASVGAILDMPKGRLSFAYVDREISYPSIQATPGECLAVSIRERSDKKTINKGNQQQKAKPNLKEKGEQKKVMKPPETTKEKAPPNLHQKQRGKWKARRQRSIIRRRNNKITILLSTKSGGSNAQQLEEMLQKTLQLFPGARVREVEIKNPEGIHKEVELEDTGDGAPANPQYLTQA